LVSKAMACAFTVSAEASRTEMALARNSADIDSRSTPSASWQPRCNNASQSSPRSDYRRSIQIGLPSETPRRLSNGKRSFTPFAIEQAMKKPEKTVIGKGNRSTIIAERKFAPGPQRLDNCWRGRVEVRRCRNLERVL
jgi:hypothetical protein